MEEHFGSMMLVFFSLILVISVYLQLKSKRTKIYEPQVITPQQPDFSQSQATSNFFSLSVFAKANHRFASYDLLQAIAATGMQFGEMNIFHYYQRSPQGKKITLFSLASATKPGEFDLDRMGNFSCIGLTMFMDITQLPNPLQAFYLMIGTAEQLADDLDGELRLDPRTRWTSAHLHAYEKRIMQQARMAAV